MAQAPSQHCHGNPGRQIYPVDNYSQRVLGSLDCSLTKSVTKISVHALTGSIEMGSLMLAATLGLVPSS